MSLANFIMLALGLLSFAVGTALLIRRGGSDQARVARRMIGVMAAALGMVLVIFAIGLSGPRSAADA